MPKSFIYNYALSNLLDFGNNWKWNDTGSNLYMLLVSGTYSGTSSSNIYESDVTGWEVVSATYQRQRITGTSTNGQRIITLDNIVDTAYHYAVNVVFSGINNCTAAGAIIFNSGGGTPSTNILFCYITGSGFPVTCNGQNLTITFSPSGVFQISGGQ